MGNLCCNDDIGQQSHLVVPNHEHHELVRLLPRSIEIELVSRSSCSLSMIVPQSALDQVQDLIQLLDDWRREKEISLTKFIPKTKQRYQDLGNQLEVFDNRKHE